MKLKEIIGYSTLTTFCCGGLLLLCILLPLSLHKIEADEVGIARNGLTEEIYLADNGNAFAEGRHVLTPASEFLIFKRTVQTLDFESDPIKCLSSEGLQMELKITLQYELDTDHVMDVLTHYGLEESWKDYLTSLARDSLMDVCGNYTADDYFHYRADIEKNLFDDVTFYFREAETHAKPVVLNLRNVQHPGQFVTTNQDKQEIEQEKDRLVREREDLTTKETTLLLKAKEEAKIKIINANATAEAAVEKAKATVQATLAKAEALGPAIIDRATKLAPAENARWTKRASVLLEIWSRMDGISLNDFLDTYFRYNILTQQDGKKVMSLSTKDVNVNLISLLEPNKLVGSVNVN